MTMINPSEILHKLIDLGITNISMENLNLNETTASFLQDEKLKIKLPLGNIIKIIECKNMV